MNSIELNKKRSRAESYFRNRYNLPAEEAKDFASFCVAEWVKGRDFRTNLNFMVVDYFRSSTVSGKSYRTKDLMKRGCKIDQKTGNFRFGTAIEQSFKIGSLAAILQNANVSSRQRAILILFYEWEFTQQEIAYLFAVTEARISQERLGAEQIMRNAPAVKTRSRIVSAV